MLLCCGHCFHMRLSACLRKCLTLISCHKVVAFKTTRNVGNPASVRTCLMPPPACSSKPSTARKLLQKKYQLSPDPDNKGCYLYRAVTGDSIDDIAKALGVSAAGTGAWAQATLTWYT